MTLQKINEGTQKAIYTIAVIRTDNPNRDESFSIGEDQIRTVAWTSELPDAMRIVRDNIGDIAELGHYSLVVIEEIYEGVYPTAARQWWAIWDNKLQKYIQITRPKQYKRFGRIGM